MFKRVLLIVTGFALYAANGAAAITQDPEPVPTPACTHDSRWPFDCLEQSAAS